MRSLSGSCGLPSPCLLGLGLVTAIGLASCVESDRAVDPGVRLSGFAVADSADQDTYVALKNICSGMRQFRNSDTVARLAFHTTYRQQFGCREMFHAEICPTWIADSAASNCHGPVLLSKYPLNATSNTAPRRLADGDISSAAFIVNTGDGQGLLFESKGAFEIVITERP